MSAETMKLGLIQWLTQMNDKGLLASLLQFKKANEAADWYDTLSQEQQAAIAEGEADIVAGRVRSSTEVWRKYGRSPKG
ncbi:MAG: hypothetical protein IT227_00765 [Flavobacteriales bacterium]|nr:hypothetical protein [Flavobacteriales bacterium]